MTSPPTPSPKITPLPTPSDPNLIYEIATSFPPLSSFQSLITHPALTIPAKQTAELRRTLSHLLMRRPKQKDIYPVPPEEVPEGSDAKTLRKIVLKLKRPDDPVKNDTEKDDDIYSDPTIQNLLSQSPANTITKSTYTLETGYADLTVEQSLRLLLPASTPEIPSSFEIAGHIAHINIRDDLLPFRKIIGKVIMDKNQPRIQTVVNKLGNVDGEFRIFPMEVIAGEDNMVVEVKESGCRFRLNFAEVYWNSRLQFEHGRVVKLIAGKSGIKKVSEGGKQMKSEKQAENVKTIQKNDEPIIVADVMAGVGPFAIPLSSQYSNITVHANDLNPQSFHYLQVNSKLNKCDSERCQMYNTDGRAFLHYLQDNNVLYHHAIMNLPAIAPEFLDAFRGYVRCGTSDGDGINVVRMPMIHVHCFAPKDKEEATKEAVSRCEKALGCMLDTIKHEVCVHVVRDVSPKKNMVCVSFRLPEAVKDLDRVKLEERVPLKVDAEDQSPGKKEGTVEVARSVSPVHKKLRKE